LAGLVFAAVAGAAAAATTVSHRSDLAVNRGFVASTVLLVALAIVAAVLAAARGETALVTDPTLIGAE
ncbi:MAG: hypothetical protein ACYDB7_05620, partial [Mycobacteriales bacterium]